MPIPFLIIGVAATGILGLGGHWSAQEKNEEANKIVKNAQIEYNIAKGVLEEKQKETTMQLEKFGNNKICVLNSSIKDFLASYEKIKHIEFKELQNTNELSKFTINNQEIAQLEVMSEQYNSSFSNIALGGAKVALALDGITTLTAISPVFTTITMPTLAPMVAPLLFVTAFVADNKADENLEKARAMQAEAEEEIEKMKTAGTLCVSIGKRAEMFNKLLMELNELFSSSVGLLSEMINKKTLHNPQKLKATDFTDEEIELISVTRALAGTIKSLLDTPILNKKGALSAESKNIYSTVQKEIPQFERIIEKHSDI